MIVDWAQDQRYQAPIAIFHWVNPRVTVTTTSEIVELDVQISRTLELDVELFAALLPFLGWSLIWPLLK